ncbi:hypothetical protein NP493_2231g00004 [Ridgeia piscesae]|uniref:Uncharacterized protein n=1 Tax=Ridgeia piscesae TaxID=27915 RepID=A0AAD9JJ60_RIDPI|nr:hypothetical protein NP493_2231g00004 [Ridgeia piscesae]
MSAEQRKLKLWLQNTSNVIRRWELMRQRNTILHAMRRKARNNNRSETRHAGVRRRAPPRRRKYVSRCFRNVEAAGCKTYHSRRSRTCVIPQCRSQCARENIRDASVYTNAVTTGRTYYSRRCAVCNRLNSGRASGYVGIPAELFKCTADLLAHTIANSFNEALEVHEQLGLGNGNFITETGQAYRSADKFTPNSITIGASEDAVANCSNEDHAENWAHVHVPRLA